jgi:hypothetical protein
VSSMGVRRNADDAVVAETGHCRDWSLHAKRYSRSSRCAKLGAKLFLMLDFIAYYVLYQSSTTTQKAVGDGAYGIGSTTVRHRQMCSYP